MPVLAEELTRFKAHRWQISCLEFNHDGSRLASGGWDKEVHIWDLGSLATVHTLKGSRVPITCLSWYRPNSGILCTGSADQTASLWNAETGKRITTLGEHFGWVLSSCFSATGSLLATASWDKTVRIWDAGTATLINNLDGHAAGVWSVDFHPDSATLCSGGQDGSVIIWDARSNRPVRNLSYGHTDAVYSAKWSPDGALIASGSADTKICIWEPSKGSVINTIYGHTDTVKSIAFNPNSDNVALPILASAGDYSVRLSDPRPTQKADILSLSLHAPGKEVEAVSISPDGSLLVTGGRDGKLILMNLHVPSVVPRTETRTTTSSTVRHSCEILEQSRMRSISDPTDTLSEGSTTELENLRTPWPEADELKFQEMSKPDPKRSSRHIKRNPDIAAVVTLRRTHDKRIKDKVVDIPTMIAHLSARASIIEDPNSSSSSNSSSESDDDSADSEDLERRFLVNVSERANQFMKQENMVQNTRAENAPPPPPQKLSLLPDEAVGRLKENRNVFEKREAVKERTTSLFDDDTMDSVVLLMKSYLDENKPSVTTAPGQSDKVEQDYLHQIGGLIPGEGAEDPDSLNSSSASADFVSDSHHHASGHYSLSPERPNTDLDRERTASDSHQSATSSTDDKRPSLKSISSASGNEYGDEVPLSMI